MKTFILLTLSLFATHMLSAQYCGGSGTFQCSSPGNATQPGFYPPSIQAAPLTNGVAVNRFVEFLNYDTLLLQGATLHVDSLVILSISNLPAGLCWSTNKPTNTFMNQEDGCIRFNGTPCALPGQYKLNIIIKLYSSLGLPLTSSSDVFGLPYDMRLINSGELLQAVDTTQTSADSIILYGPASNCQPGPPTVSLGNNQSICNNSFLILDPIISGGTAPFTYSWQYSGNALSCSTCKNPSVTLTQASTFTVAITDADNYTAVGQVTYTPSGTNNMLQLSSGNTNINCSNSIDNTTINVTNGSLPLTLSWGDGGA